MGAKSVTAKAPGVKHHGPLDGRYPRWWGFASDVNAWVPKGCDCRDDVGHDNAGSICQAPPLCIIYRDVW